MNREKAIRGLECCAEAKCEICPYEDQCFGEEICICSPMAKDMLELIKAQEPKDPVYTAFYDIGGKNLSHWDCGACGAFLYGAAWFGSTLKDDRPKYCSRCGRAVKWDA